METIGDRIRAEREAQKMSRETLAKLAGLGGYSSVSEIERGGQKSSTKLHTIATVLGLNVEWLEKKRGPKYAVTDTAEWEEVLGYGQVAGLGDSAEAQEYVETNRLKFRADSLRRKGLHAGKLHVFKGKGESMLPRIQPGDAILFDESDASPKDGALYVILASGNGNNEYQVKRAMVLDGVTYFVADNPSGAHAWAKPRKMDDRKNPIKVVGRVRWIGSWED